MPVIKKADHPAAGFQHQDGADYANHQVAGQPIPLAFENGGDIGADIIGAVDCRQNQRPVQKEPECKLVFACSLKRWFKQKGQGKDGAQVKGSLNQGGQGGHTRRVKLVQAQTDSQDHHHFGNHRYQSLVSVGRQCIAHRSCFFLSGLVLR